MEALTDSNQLLLVASTAPYPAPTTASQPDRQDVIHQPYYLGLPRPQRDDKERSGHGGDRQACFVLWRSGE